MKFGSRSLGKVSPPPSTEGSIKRPWWKRWYGILGIIVAVLCVLGFLVSLFSPEKTVPDVVGKSVPEAQEILKAEGFTNVSVDLVDKNRDLEDGDYEVVRQDPRSGRSIKTVNKVTLTAKPNEEAAAKLKAQAEAEERKQAEAEKRAAEEAERKKAEAKKRAADAEAAEKAPLQKIDKVEGYQRCVDLLTGWQQGVSTSEPIADSAKWTEKRSKDHQWEYELAFKAKLHAQGETAYIVMRCRVYFESYDGEHTFIDASQSSVEHMPVSKWDAWH
ncbi:PASTA domain-containing protein [Nanchangia anserum]|uniref:PASTA domain-containing protein n=1 Tax=Nanchangia anserum TaxID=2692125 RepID=A0A8I0GFS6_9ACTO|nr:PASTA domain-containing protein [Nanchangia anserum]MBD3689224.1 PASTA domain-containing protein [Nanchangia anserum]QOX81447.1 PASTA domain-containing protein [Nanchangia anserum]